MFKVNWWKIDFGENEIQHIANSIRNCCLSMGSKTKQFEQKIAEKLNVEFVLAVPSGSVALFMALKAAGIKSGDEVIVPNRTWIATAHAVQMLGAKVVLVDVLQDKPNIDVTLIQEKINSRTKAILPVHLNGRSANMDEIRKVSDENQLIVIEDAAQAFMSFNAAGYLGCQSLAGCFSLSVSKLISTAQGGFISTNDKKLNQHLIRMRTQGVDDLVNTTFNEWGFNFRYTDIQASIGLEQLNKIDLHISRVCQIYNRYKEAIHSLSTISLIENDINNGEIPIYVEVLCENRDSLIHFLKNKKIQTRPFYPNINSAPHLKDKSNFKCSDRFSMQGLFLPSGPGQSDHDIDYVIDSLYEYEKLSV